MLMYFMDWLICNLGFRVLINPDCDRTLSLNFFVFAESFFRSSHTDAGNTGRVKKITCKRRRKIFKRVAREMPEAKW